MRTLTRSEAARTIREHLYGIAQHADDKVECDVAGEERVFCRGFDRFPTEYLRERFRWLAHGDRNLSREELLDLIRRWIQAREFVLNVCTACEVMAREEDLCRGTNSFSNEKLAASFQEVFGERVRVVDDPA